MTTIKDVAKRANVSISTVSNALNGVSYVKEETKKRIEEAVLELNYVPNLNARLLKAQKSSNFGLFLPNFNSLFYVKLLQAMYSSCQKINYSLVIHISDSLTSKEIVAAVLSSNIDGAVILNEHLDDSDIPALKTKKIPYVFLDKCIKDDSISSVLVNNGMGIAQGTEYLIHSGHKTIAFLHGQKNFDSDERLSEFKKVMESFSLPVYEDLIFNGFFEENAAYSVIRGNLPYVRQKPDAIFCANDEMALGCMKALSDLNLTIPQDISVIGFDDAPVAAECPIPLTTIQNPTEYIGRQTIAELVRLKDSTQEGQIIRADTQLIIRKSCHIRFGNNGN